MPVPAAVAAVLDRPFDAASLSQLRRHVLAYAQAAGLTGKRAIDVMLAVHELAANAVRHGAGSGRLQAQLTEGTLRCRVADPGRDARDGAPSPLREWPVKRGHGLWLVRQAADHVDMVTGPGGSEVIAVFAIT